jgi:hypothetical protein
LDLHFVVGTGRCGSSLVHEILAQHEDVGFISNIDDNLPRLGLSGRFNNSFYRWTKGSWTRKGALRFAPSEAYRLVTQEVSPVYANSFRNLRAEDVTPWLRTRFERFFERRWMAQRKACFLHKYTGWPRVGFFGEIFPHARFVHIVRDGRAVANSWLQMEWWGGHRGPEHWPWGPLNEEETAEWRRHQSSFIALAGLCWRRLMESFEADAACLPGDRYLVLRYEDIVAMPKEQLQRIAEFVGLRWSRRIAAVADGMALDSSRKRAFEADLTAAQNDELTRVIGPILARYGYE